MSHGHCGDGRKDRSKTYNSWRAMLQRCLQTSHEQYKNYGGRGITVCEDWKDFKNFLKDMGERPYKKTLDRINPEGNYEPAKNKRKNAKVFSENTDKYNERGNDDSAQS